MELYFYVVDVLQILSVLNGIKCENEERGGRGQGRAGAGRQEEEGREAGRGRGQRGRKGVEDLA